jgi:hypothetical protein
VKAVTDLAKTVLDNMKKVKEALYQTKNRSGQDPSWNCPLSNRVKVHGGIL